MKISTKLLVVLSLLVAIALPATAEVVKDGTPDQFTLRAGDILQINVWKEEGLDQEVLVLPDGTLTFPLIGTIQAQGFTPAHLQANIKQMLTPLIPDAAVTVTVKAPLGHTVSVMGQVAKPGDFVMGQRLSVMQALSQAGGLTPYADEDEIIIIRIENGKKKSLPFPYRDIAKGEDLDKDISLKPGDVVLVPTAGLL